MEGKKREKKTKEKRTKRLLCHSPNQFESKDTTPRYIVILSGRGWDRTRVGPASGKGLGEPNMGRARLGKGVGRSLGRARLGKGLGEPNMVRARLGKGLGETKPGRGLLTSLTTNILTRSLANSMFCRMK